MTKATERPLVALKFEARLGAEGRTLHIYYAVQNPTRQPMILFDRVERPPGQSGGKWTDACFHLIEDDVLVLARHTSTKGGLQLYLPVWPTGRHLPPGGQIEHSMVAALPLEFWNPWIGPMRANWPSLVCKSVMLRIGLIAPADVPDLTEATVDGERSVSVPFLSATRHEHVIESLPQPLEVPVSHPRFLPEDQRSRRPAI